MDKEKMKNLTNEELEKLLSEADYCDRDLLREYDERNRDGRIKWGDPIPLDKLEEFIKNRYSEKRKEKAS